MMAMGPAQINIVSVSPDVKSSIEGGGCCCLIGEPTLTSEVRPQAKVASTSSQGDGTSRVALNASKTPESPLPAS
jgi:hypothetical protein